MRLFSYIVARDYGFAPNPFHGWSTLATCKPEIRRRATVGDWVLGTGSARYGRTGYVVYAMRVQEKLTFAQYWSDPRFERKRPNLAGSRKMAFGDNIYRPNDGGGFDQLDSHHSLHDGTPNPRNVQTDTRIDAVLVSQEFIYWGGDGPLLPDELCDAVRCPARGDRCRFPEQLVDETVAWLCSFQDRGFQGRPSQWD